MSWMCTPRGAIVVVAFVGTLLGAAAEGCGGSNGATPAELQRLGSKKYPGHSREEMLQAATTALKVMGYEIVTTTPRIRTSPKLVSATGTRVQVYAQELGWEIDVQADAQGASILAKGHAVVNGKETDRMPLDWLEPHYTQLFKEIDANMPAAK